MTHDFGFGALRNKYVRLWVGPRMNVAVYKKININGLNISGDVVGLAVGPVIGVNIHLPKVATFSVAASHLRGRYIGDYNGTGGSSIDLDFDVDSTFVNFSVLFRIKDEY
ncbi:MAG: hypothetical protein GXP19_09190 [Gammaproteobacteria bacterium]|nr:hypothetical protein [Gammaproteobacteria bacterium]